MALKVGPFIQGYQNTAGADRHVEELIRGKQIYSLDSGAGSHVIVVNREDGTVQYELGNRVKATIQLDEGWADAEPEGKVTVPKQLLTVCGRNDLNLDWRPMPPQIRR